jgi:hypothetical protein
MPARPCRSIKIRARSAGNPPRRDAGRGNAEGDNGRMGTTFVESGRLSHADGIRETAAFALPILQGLPVVSVVGSRPFPAATHE